MKKKLVLSLFLILVPILISAQGLYFDAGAGIGQAWTRLSGQNAINVVNSRGLQASQFGTYIGLKAGYGPVADMPFFVVCDLSMISHVMDLRYYSAGPNQANRGSFGMSLSSIIIGPGIVYYPITLVQLGLSAGFSFVNNTNDLPDGVFRELMFSSKGGFAWNASAALDFGRRNHGCLVGLQLFHAINPLQVSNITQNAFQLGVFVKYTYRQKPFLPFF